jgi:pimeloyl-ACP methyl ester carboxylesterase
MLILVVLLLRSKGTPEPFMGKDGRIIEGSISEKTFITIGGIKQGMFIRGKNTDNPVLLYVHGGPAFPNYFLFEKYKPGLEDLFTVCYWEQRGGGLSYSPEVTLESMNFSQLTSDLIDVTNYLRNRFGKDRIYLMAHSGGTPFAIMAAARAPELFSAYLGMAQITNQAESERVAWNFMKEEYKARGDKKALSDLLSFPVADSSSSIPAFYKSLVRDKSMHELGIGTMRQMRSVFSGVFIPVWLCRAYTLKEKYNIWKSKFTFVKKARFVEELFNTDIPMLVPEIKIPVYFFSGEYDLTVNKDLSAAYLKNLKAPVKGFYSFSESAHSPLFEEPARFRDIMVKDILTGKNELAQR